jgi:hypothetical protein
MEVMLWAVVLTAAIALGLWGCCQYWAGRQLKISKEAYFQLALELVRLAESLFGSKTGPIKYAYVSSQLYGALPIPLRFLISEAQIGEWIDLAVRKLEQELEDNLALEAQKEEDNGKQNLEQGY